MLYAVGSKTASSQQGISLIDFNASTGRISNCGGISGVEHPTFLAWDAMRSLLFVAEETSRIEDGRAGSFACFAGIDPVNRVCEPRMVSRTTSCGDWPCHLLLHPSGRHLYVSNYGNGVFASVPLDSDGVPDGGCIEFHHEGTGFDPARQECSHIHSSLLSPDGRYVYTADLGLDCIYSHAAAFDGFLVPEGDRIAVRLAPGAGPRHMAWSACSRYLYVVEELANRVSVCMAHDDGTLSVVQTISTLSTGCRAVNLAADIHLDATGRYLWVSNRGCDDLAVFPVDASCGRLLDPMHVSCGGCHPRNFSLDPSGDWVLVANACTDSLEVFNIHRHADRVVSVLPHTGISLQMPMCVIPLLA
jgi:6-phosphogluconolactonase